MDTTEDKLVQDAPNKTRGGIHLIERHCFSLKGGATPLSANAEETLLHEVPGWSIDRSSMHKLRKTYTLNSFIDAVDFVNSIATIAEFEKHHPDIIISNKTVTVELYTRSLRGLSENDFIVAAQIDTESM